MPSGRQRGRGLPFLPSSNLLSRRRRRPFSSLLGSPFPPTTLYQIIHYEKEEEEGGETFLRVLSLAGDGRGRQRRAKEAISRQGKSEERDLCQCVLGVVNRSERERESEDTHSPTWSLASL